MVARVDRFSCAVVAASAAHAVVIAAVLRSVAPEEPSEFAARPSSVGIELVDLELPSAETDSHPSPKRSDATSASGAVRSLPTAKGAGEIPVSRAGAPARESALDASSRAGQPEVMAKAETMDKAPSNVESAEAPRFSLEQLGLEGPNRLAVGRFADAPSAATTREAATNPVGSGERPLGIVRSMRQLAQDHDRKVGLGTGGPIATALERATYRSHGALNGQATFEVVVIGKAVSSVSVVSSSIESESLWNDVGKGAFAQLSGRSVRSTAGSRGVVLRIQVVSRDALPSGHDPGVEVTIGPFVVQRGRGKRSARVAFLDSVQALSSLIELPGTAARLAAPGAVLSLVRTDIDPVDLGASDRQVVHSYTLNETLLD